MNAPVTKEIREIAMSHAAYNIAWGLQRIVCYRDEVGEARAREGAEMLHNGIREALELLCSTPEVKP